MRYLPGPRVRRLAAALALVALAVGLAACGSSKSNNGGGSSTTPTTAAAPTAAAKALAPYLVEPQHIANYPALPRAPPRGKLLYFLAASPSDVSVSIDAGLRQATSLVGWQYKSLKYNRVDPAGPNSALISAVNGGADEVVVAAVAAQQIRSGLAQAQAKRVPVVVIAPNGPTAGVPGIIGQISATTTASASAGAEALALGPIVDAERSGVTAHIGIVTAPEYASIFKPVNDHIAATVKQFCTACTADTIDVPLSDVASGKNGSDIVSYLQKNPQVNYLVMDVGLFDIGVRPLLNSVGRKDVKVFGNVPGVAQMQDMAAGGSSGWLVVPQDFNAWLAVDACVRALTGGNSHIHDNEPPASWLVTPAAKAGGSSMPSFPLDFRQRLAQLWHVG